MPPCHQLTLMAGRQPLAGMSNELCSSTGVTSGWGLIGWTGLSLSLRPPLASGEPAGYATAAALFLGVFVIRYHLELILSVPLIAGFFATYMRIALKEDSPVQAPERLYRERGLMVYLLICLAAFVGLMFVHVPVLYEWFNVEPSSIPSLWAI